MNYNAIEDIAKLKANIKNMLSAELHQFYEATGLEPCAINIHIIETTRFGDHVKRWDIGSVGVRFDF